MIFESDLANSENVIKISTLFDELISNDNTGVLGKLKKFNWNFKKEIKLPLTVNEKRIEVVPLGFSIKYDECHVGVSPVHKGFSKHIKLMANNTEVSVIFNVDVNFKRYQIEVLNNGEIAYSPKTVDESFIEGIVKSLLEVPDSQ